MAIWQIILIVYFVIDFILLYFMFKDENLKTEKSDHANCSFLNILIRNIVIGIILIGLPIIFIAGFVIFGGVELIEYLKEVIEHGGFIKYHKWKKQDEIEREERRIREEKLKEDYLNGAITKEDLPRVLDGEERFEFEENILLDYDYNESVGDLIYVESERCESLNQFFIKHKDLRLYEMYRFVYLPNMLQDFCDGERLHYLFPELDSEDMIANIDSTLPLNYLWYPEDRKKIGHGMFYFRKGYHKFGAKYFEGHFYPLNEGSDEDIIQQLDAIVKKAHYKYGGGGLYYKMRKPELEEGSVEDYADQLFKWVVIDDEAAILIEEVRERVKRLKEKGIAEKLLFRYIEEKPELSRLVITKDLRIMLPDYHDMEIQMEPMNKAVFLLFLNHPEGIIFKHLPDYREELAEIYQKIKPYGLNERSIRSIEDVTNPCLNSINEKCARIRGSFISQFDESLAKHYYITGERGEAKKITLPRDLVIWE